MKVVVEENEGEGLDALLGLPVLLLCGNYFYHGKLVGVNETVVKLSSPSIVYETGDWKETKYKNAQLLPAKVWYVQTAAIESFGPGLPIA